MREFLDAMQAALGGVVGAAGWVVSIEIADVAWAAYGLSMGVTERMKRNI